MSDAEKVEDGAVVEKGSSEIQERHAAAPERLAKLPLEALLFYVMYGDEGLTRLT